MDYYNDEVTETIDEKVTYFVTDNGYLSLGFRGDRSDVAEICYRRKRTRVGSRAVVSCWGQTRLLFILTPMLCLLEASDGAAQLALGLSALGVWFVLWACLRGCKSEWRIVLGLSLAVLVGVLPWTALSLPAAADATDATDATDASDVNASDANASDAATAQGGGSGGESSLTGHPGVAPIALLCMLWYLQIGAMESKLRSQLVAVVTCVTHVAYAAAVLYLRPGEIVVRASAVMCVVSCILQIPARVCRRVELLDRKLHVEKQKALAETARYNRERPNRERPKKPKKAPGLFDDPPSSGVGNSDPIPFSAQSGKVAPASAGLNRQGSLQKIKFGLQGRQLVMTSPLDRAISELTNLLEMEFSQPIADVISDLIHVTEGGFEGGAGGRGGTRVDITGADDDAIEQMRNVGVMKVSHATSLTRR